MHGHPFRSWRCSGSGMLCTLRLWCLGNKGVLAWIVCCISTEQEPEEGWVQILGMLILRVLELVRKGRKQYTKLTRDNKGRGGCEESALQPGCHILCGV